ncbi:hypothetical protein [Saccharopolyspora sp. 5N708]|uniref:hypothetical protein n=1 Tax=Saccharopolyspora sp. 5N708 TaxID=3457424 RepID=UPI003FD27069
MSDYRFQPADPGINVADVGVLLRADLSTIDLLSLRAPESLTVQARADGVAVLPRTAPYGTTGSCEQPIITIGDQLLLPWGAEPMRTHSGDRAIRNLTSLISGLACARRDPGQESDLLVGPLGGPIALNATTGSLADWGGAPAEIMHVVFKVAGGGLEETLAVVQPGRPATIGVPHRADGGSSSPPPVRFPERPGRGHLAGPERRSAARDRRGAVTDSSDEGVRGLVCVAARVADLAISRENATRPAWETAISR